MPEKKSLIPRAILIFISLYLFVIIVLFALRTLDSSTVDECAAVRHFESNIQRPGSKQLGDILDVSPQVEIRKSWMDRNFLFTVLNLRCRGNGHEIVYCAGKSAGIKNYAISTLIAYRKFTLNDDDAPTFADWTVLDNDKFERYRSPAVSN